MTQDIFELAPSVREKWPFAARYARVNGWRMHYVDEGDGDPVLLLHGNPTWGFLYRDVIGPLVQSGRRVIVPDMIGFGLSEKPTREARAHARWTHRQSGEPRAPARADARHSGLPRLGRPDRTVICHEQPRQGSGARRHEHLGVATPAGRVPHARVSVALDARAAGRAISPRPTQRPRGPGCLSVRCRSG